ncbi:MAG: PIN domain-containing protein [Candidatus Diapherotrites archaeon]|uniref:PIN domain-containing protein n=1 Tax=Candidatus Iainarchaeum sp. TaxID=3101447 RepID=A0A938YVN1_9ARCH|nr:PIN domain-containing protein [Candidatus Diapherotrites archaeon]
MALENSSERKPTQDKMLVDSCILVYLVDKTEKGKHEKARQWFETIRWEKNYFVSIQNLREYANISLRKTALPAGEIVENISLFSETFNTVFDRVEDITAAIGLAGTRGKLFWDAMLAATMQRHGINTILTENTKDFKKFKEIKATNPLE